jgi:hypothetical protein
MQKFLVPSVKQLALPWQGVYSSQYGGLCGRSEQSPIRQPQGPLSHSLQHSIPGGQLPQFSTQTDWEQEESRQWQLKLPLQGSIEQPVWLSGGTLLGGMTQPSSPSGPTWTHSWPGGQNASPSITQLRLSQ